MRKLFILSYTLLVSGLINAQTLSEQSYISVITFGPGQEELYAGFGHSAIRVYDPKWKLDWAYNYGTFDYNQPNFYLNFTRGHLLYKLAVQDFPRMRQYYEYFNRSIVEQRINLTPEQRQKIFDFLQVNALPENADYLYDYFYNNCASKIGGVFVDALGDEFHFDPDYLDEPGLTIRTLTDRLTAEHHPWGKLGIDICLGMPMDQKITNLQYMFLPEYVELAFADAEVFNNGSWHNAVSVTNPLYQARPAISQASKITPELTFGAGFLVVLLLTFLSFKFKFQLRFFDVFFFLVIGLLGLLLFILWVATDHAAAAWNLNLLWAVPTHIIVAFGLLKKHRSRWVNWYMLATGVSCILLVICWPFLPQAMNTALIGVTLAIATRAFAIISYP